jgi:hypothetical protein
MKRFILPILFILCSSMVDAQSWWNDFCQNKFNYDETNVGVVKKIIASSPDPVEQSEASVATAWGMLYQRQHPDTIINLLWHIYNDVIPNNRNNDGMQSLLKDKCFIQKFRGLLDSLRTNTYQTSFGYAAQKKQEILNRIAIIERSLPHYLQTCVDVSFKVSDDNRDIEFTIKIKDCKAEVDNKGIPRGRVGYPDVYEALLDWYRNSVLAGLDKKMEVEKANTTMEIKGLADGYMVLGDLPLGFSLDIKQGKEYTYLGPDDIPVETKLEVSLEDVIPLSSKSNCYLALARACLAEDRLNGIASKISIVAQEFYETGDDYRGVELKITAKGIIDELASAKLRESKLGAERRETMNSKKF